MPSLAINGVETDAQVRTYPPEHSHVRLCQMQASELVACEQARVLGSSGQGRRRGR